MSRSLPRRSLGPFRAEALAREMVGARSGARYGLFIPELRGYVIANQPLPGQELALAAWDYWPTKLKEKR